MSFLLLQTLFDSYLTNSFFVSLWFKFLTSDIFSRLIYLHAFTQQSLFFFTSKHCLYKKRKEKSVSAKDPRNLGARDRGLSDYYSESSILESRECTEMSLRSFWRWRSSIDERSGHNGFHSADRRWSPLVVRNSLHSKLLPLVSGNRPSTSFAGNQGPVPLRSSYEFDADEARLKDSSNPFSLSPPSLH